MHCSTSVWRWSSAVLRFNFQSGHGYIFSFFTLTCFCY